MSDTDGLTDALDQYRPNETDRVTVLFGHVHGLRETLMAVERYLYASDIAKCQLNHLSEVRLSPLTQDVQSSLERVNGIISDHLMAQYSVGQAEPAEPIDEEPLPENPLGSKSLRGLSSLASTNTVQLAPTPVDED